MHDSTGHRAPDQPGIAIPDQSRHESSFGRLAAAAHADAAGGGEVPPVPDEDGLNANPNSSEPPVPGLGFKVLHRLGPWSPPDHQSLWRRLLEHGRARRAAEYAADFKHVLAVLEIEPTDIQSHATVVSMITGTDWPTHEQMMASVESPANPPLGAPSSRCRERVVVESSLVTYARCGGSLNQNRA
jgi:hypothetical protein